MVMPDGRVKVLDFGIARELKDSLSRVTGREAAGTLLYMAPEQFAGETPGPAADLYSLAATVYECLSGQPPFWQGSVGHQLMNMPPAAISMQPAHVNAALLAGLAKRPGDRPAGVGKFVRMLAAEGKDAAPKAARPVPPGPAAVATLPAPALPAVAPPAPRLVYAPAAAATKTRAPSPPPGVARAPATGSGTHPRVPSARRRASPVSSRRPPLPRRPAARAERAGRRRWTGAARAWLVVAALGVIALGCAGLAAYSKPTRASSSSTPDVLLLVVPLAAGVAAFAGWKANRLLVPPLTVCPSNGPFTTIGAAVRAAGSGQRIVVRPGVYREEVVIDKPVLITGQGSPAEVVVESDAGPCLLVRTDGATVRSIGLRGRGRPGHFPVDVPEGSLLLDSCDVTSDGVSCVAVRGPASRAMIRSCRLHDAREAGLLVCDGGRATIDASEVIACGPSGIEARAGGAVTVRRCHIHQGKGTGVLVHGGGACQAAQCEIRDNAGAGVSVLGGGDVRVSGCRVTANGATAVYAAAGSQGEVASSYLAGNLQGPWRVETGAAVRRDGNTE